MIRLILRRVALSVPILFVVSALTFLLEWLTPGDPTYTILGPDAPLELHEQLRQALGLNDPVWVQYWHWLQNVAHGSLGTSIFSSQAVVSAIAGRLPVTLSLALGGIALATVFGLALGVMAAVRGGKTGQAVDVFSLIFFAIPHFWFGIVLVAVFAVALPLFPAIGYVDFTDSPLDWLHSLILPWIALALGGMSAIGKQARDSMLDVMNRDFIRNLRANGIPEKSVIFKHALKNASIPVVTMIALQFVGLLGGSIVIEAVFALPGLGSLAVTATGQHDIPMVLGIAVYFTLMVVLTNLVLDVAYGWLNPKARLA